jgi:hypothetical protein
MPGSPIQIVVVYNKSNTFGLAKDAKLLSEALPQVCKSLGVSAKSVRLVDAREPPVPCTICIHLEEPYAAWFSWATTNVIMVNSEWWLESKWSAYWNHFTVSCFRKGTPVLSNEAHKTLIIPWTGSLRTTSPAIPANRRKEFVWFLGGSVNKRAAALALVPLWKETYPTLHIYSAEPLSFDSDVVLRKNVKLHSDFLTAEKRASIAESTAGHICISKAESFGYTAAEAEEVGAFTILNTLPCYKENYADDSTGIQWLETPVDAKYVSKIWQKYFDAYGNADFSNRKDLQASLEYCIGVFDYSQSALESISKVRQVRSLRRRNECLDGLKQLVKTCMEVVESAITVPMPPVLEIKDCPPISVITLIHNRPKFIENACLNLLHSDYPREKLEWIVVDDSDPSESPSNRVIQFQEKFAPGVVTYIPLARKRSIGFKRNLGVERAKHSILLMMDDDDHYPVTSFRRRVAYLRKGPKSYDCGVCTTIAMYDLLKGVSAVNVPPFRLSLAERCSEATLTFTKPFWNQRKFPDNSMAEGEGFLEGREDQVVEIPPQQIIVALSHGTNLTSRKMPEASPGCFWGFSRQLLEFLHGLVGVKVEEESSTTSAPLTTTTEST